MSAFPARDKRIVALYESGTLTQAQIGEMFGISQSRVQQICRARARVDGCKRRAAWLRVNHRAGRMNRFRQPLHQFRSDDPEPLGAAAPGLRPSFHEAKNA